MGRTLKWITSGEVFARILRNTGLKDDNYHESITEWMAEAIFKLKTRYQYELVCETLDIKFYQAVMPCAAEALSAVVFQGKRILPSSSDGPLLNAPQVQIRSSMTSNVFHSVLSFPKGVENLDETSVNNWPEYIKSSSLVETLPVEMDVRYRINYNKLEIGVECGKVTVYYWTIPKDETGFPLIPDNENYKHAIYWYVRSMMIGSGWEDRVFRFDYCDAQFREYCNIARNEITYPTPDEVQQSLILNNRMVDIGTGWESFFTPGAEQNFDDFR